jgi:hypothetical protein
LFPLVFDALGYACYDGYGDYAPAEKYTQWERHGC